MKAGTSGARSTVLVCGHHDARFRFCAKPGRKPLVPAYYREVITPFTAAFLPAAFRQPILCLGRITVGRVLLGSRRLRKTGVHIAPVRFEKWIHAGERVRIHRSVLGGSMDHVVGTTKPAWPHHGSGQRSCARRLFAGRLSPSCGPRFQYTAGLLR